MTQPNDSKPLIQIRTPPIKPYTINGPAVATKLLEDFATVEELVDWVSKHNTDLGQAFLDHWDETAVRVHNSDKDPTYLVRYKLYEEKRASYNAWYEKNKELIEMENQRRRRVEKQRRANNRAKQLQREVRNIEKALDTKQKQLEKLKGNK